MESQLIEDLAARPVAERVADVCVFGAGPAGITLALELARRRPDWQILLLEGGGRDVPTERERTLYRTELGERDYATDASRRRMLGGTSMHWGGWCKPFDPTDFDVPPDWPTPPWPFGPETIAPYLDAAHRWCEIAATSYDTDAVQARHPGKLLPLPADASVTQRLFRFSPPTRFGTRYEADLAAQTNLTCLLHANLTGMQRHGERIVSASVRTLDGAPVTVRADRFVLALGGLETTRFLLNLRGDASDDGIGLRSPHLGRGFADHYGINAGVVLAPASLSYARLADEGTPVMPVLTPSDAVLRAGTFQNCCMMLNPDPTPDPLLDRYAGQAALGFRPGDFWRYKAPMIVEPRPVPDSRISLVDERCELGLRRMKLDWRIDPRDSTSALAFFDEAGRTLAQLGLGRSRRLLDDTAALQGVVFGANHHVGTTRFSHDPRDGVADPDGRMHDSDNLHVLSTSLFPRHGYSNPTLTLVALAVRMAEQFAGAPAEVAA